MSKLLLVTTPLDGEESFVVEVEEWAVHTSGSLWYRGTNGLTVSHSPMSWFYAEEVVEEDIQYATQD